MEALHMSLPGEAGLHLGFVGGPMLELVFRVLPAPSFLRGNLWSEVRPYFTAIRKKANDQLKKIEPQQGPKTATDEEGWTEITRKRGPIQNSEQNKNNVILEADNSQ